MNSKYATTWPYLWRTHFKTSLIMNDKRCTQKQNKLWKEFSGSSTPHRNCFFFYSLKVHVLQIWFFRSSGKRDTTPIRCSSGVWHLTGFVARTSSICYFTTDWSLICYGSSIVYQFHVTFGRLLKVWTPLNGRHSHRPQSRLLLYLQCPRDYS